MKTLVAMLSYGDRCHLSDPAFRRASQWASRHGYSALLVKEPLHRPGESPHFGKLRLPEVAPGYNRYLILDDDLLITARAPALPATPPQCVALAPDAEQRHTTNPLVRWTGNTGFILIHRQSLDLFSKALSHGDEPTVWPGFADQAALNAVAWREGRVHQLDKAWNYQPVLEYFLTGKDWPHWLASRSYRLGFYARVLLRAPHPVIACMRSAYGIHLIRAPYPRFFDRVLA